MQAFDVRALACTFDGASDCRARVPRRPAVTKIASRAMALAFAALLAASGPAAAFELVTAAEAAADLTAPAPARTRSLPVPGAPRIELLAPDTGRPVPAPMDLRLRWTPQGDATIDRFSVRVLYGKLGLDVSSRVLAAAKVDAAGLDAPGARLPVGTHLIAVEVMDSARRMGRREFSVQIVP